MRCLLILLSIKIPAEHSTDGKTNPEMNINFDEKPSLSLVSSNSIRQASSDQIKMSENFDEKPQSPLTSSDYTRQDSLTHIKMGESIDESKNNTEFRRALSDQGAFPGLKTMKNDRGSNSKWPQMKIKRLNDCPEP